MIWATVSSWSCFRWLYRTSPSLAAKNIINLTECGPLEKGMANHFSILAWRIPGIGGAWWAAIYGIAQSRTRLKRLSSSSKGMHWSQQTPSSNNTIEDSTHGHHQMVNTKIRLIIFFAAKDGEALYTQHKQDQELTVAWIMNSLLPNSDWSWRKWTKLLDHSGMT